MAIAYPNKSVNRPIVACDKIWRSGRKVFMEYWFKNLPRMYKSKKNLAHWLDTRYRGTTMIDTSKTRLVFGKYGPIGPKFFSFDLYSHNTTFLLFFCYFGFLNHDYIIENTLLARKIKNKLKELQNV